MISASIQLAIELSGNTSKATSQNSEKTNILLAPLAVHLFIEGAMAVSDLIAVGGIYFAFEFVVDILLALILDRGFGIPMMKIKMQNILSRAGLEDAIVQAFAVNIICCGTCCIWARADAE